MAQLTFMAWAALGFQFVAFYIVPIALWVLLTRRLHVSWRFVGLGSLTWLTALPLIILVPLGATMLLGYGDLTKAQLVWGGALAFAAGIGEETSRYFYYRRNKTLCEPQSVRATLVAGSGHGGTESLVLGLQYFVAPLVMLLFMAQSLPAEMRDNNAIISFALLGGLSRILFVIAHIGFTLMVWRAVVQRQLLLYVAAVVLHVIIDLLGFVPPVVWPGSDWLVLVPTLPLAVWALLTLARELRKEWATANVGQAIANRNQQSEAANPLW